MPVRSVVMSPLPFWLLIICVFSIFFLINLARGLSSSLIFSEPTLGFIGFSIVCLFTSLLVSAPNFHSSTLGFVCLFLVS